jgi:O-antigen ligase
MGGTVHTNVLGRLAVLVAIAGLAYQRDPKLKFLCRVVVVAAIAVLIFTKSRTGLATMIGGFAALRLVSSSSRKLFMLGCGSLGAVGAVLLLLTFGGTWMQRQTAAAMTLGRGEDVTSLTGRLPLWQSIWNESRDRSVTGFGYGAFWLPEKTQDIGAELNWFPRHAHSAYVEILVNLGLVGVAIGIATAVCGVVRAAHVAVKTDLPEYRVLTAWLVAGLVNGVAEAAFVLPRDLGIIVSASMFGLVFVHPRVAALLDESPARKRRAAPSFASIVARRRNSLLGANE